MKLKDLIKEELKQAGKNLKEAGHDIAEEALEEVLSEMSDVMGRVATKSDSAVLKIYLAIKPIVDAEIDKIDGEVDAE